MKNSKFKISYRILVLILISFLILGLGTKAFLIRGKETPAKKNLTDVLSSSVKPVSAQEIYPMFECPCCGKPIDQCTCPMAKERKAFIDGLTSRNISEDEAVMAYVKNYGLKSFVDKNKQAEFKEKLIAQAPADRPIITVSPELIDLGDISQAKGEVNTLFEITNTGKADLIINKLETSCGCTSASVVYHDKEGPIFSMPGHGKDGPDWQVIIPAGEKAHLKVYYDSNVHQDFRGTAIREIYIFSNDPINFETKVKIELNQTE